jgi:hypothetical protein
LVHYREYYDQIHEVEIGRLCSEHGKDDKHMQVLVRTPKGKRPLGKPRRRCQYNIKNGSYGISVVQSIEQTFAFLATLP